jgi:ribosome biogenesis GTPase A
MKKTKDMIKENIKIIDIVLEIVDARIPISSKNPDIKKLAKNKKRILLLNKSDLVEKEEIEFWKKYMKNNNYADEVLEISAETGFNLKKLYSEIDKAAKTKIEKLKKKGLKNVTVRLLIAGIPNVGKSKLINLFVGKKATGVGNRPGFTRGKQWVRIKKGYELLDTPGILWPKFESEDVGINLAITGSIKDEILDTEDVAKKLIEFLKKTEKIGLLNKKYKIEENMELMHEDVILEVITKKLGLIQKGGKLNTSQGAFAILRDYRSAKLGKFGVDTLLVKDEI